MYARLHIWIMLRTQQQSAEKVLAMEMVLKSNKQHLSFHT